MVPTQALLVALAALAEPLPPNSTPAPDVPQQFASAGAMSPGSPMPMNAPTSGFQTQGKHADPKKSGSGGGGGSSGGSGSTSSSSKAATASTAKTGTNTSASTATSSGTASTPTTGEQATTPSVLPTPTDPAIDPTATAAAFALTATSTSTPSSADTTAAVLADAVSDRNDAPVQTPEPGTMILLVLAGAGVGGGTVLRKWVKGKAK